MNDGLLSQEEINALLGGETSVPEASIVPQESTTANEITESDKDLLGEIGNISMGSASTALSTILNKKVNITTPKVSLITIDDIKNGMDVPMVALEVLYTEGLTGANLLIMRITDAAVIANLMMGGNGEVDTNSLELGELELSAVAEAMNQMVGSSATSLATMLGFPVNISPPTSRVWSQKSEKLADHVDEFEEIVKIAFKLSIENHVDSEIMLILRKDTARIIIDKMTGVEDNNVQSGKTEEVVDNSKKETVNSSNNNFPRESKGEYTVSSAVAASIPSSEAVNQNINVQKAEFTPLNQMEVQEGKNIDLILDVPLEISVVLGRAKKTIKDILDLGTGSLIELDKLTEEPVEILVNGKKVAVGEVVVIDENFGVRITNIVNSIERVKSLQD